MNCAGSLAGTWRVNGVSRPCSRPRWSTSCDEEAKRASSVGEHGEPEEGAWCWGASVLGAGVWTLSLRDRKIERFGTVGSPWHISATFAPNGRWVAYAEGEGSASRVYAEPFPRTGDRFPVTNDARSPFWSPDGRELFYYASGLDQLRAVTFSTQPTVTFGNAVQVPSGGLQGITPVNFRREYDLSPDGKRILGVIAAQATQQALAPTIQVVLNWQSALGARER